MKKLIWLFFRTIKIAFLVVGSVWIASEAAVEIAAWGRTYDRIADVPAREYGLVLGTSKFVAPGRPNLHYQYRMDAAAELFRAGKVRRLIVSGNGAKANYNEPRMMRDDLVARGVPVNRILADNAGLRTFDSVVRAKSIFHAPDFIVVSQRAHNERAIFIGRFCGADPIGWNARSVSFWTDPKTVVREHLARVLAAFDVLAHRVAPKSMGAGNALSSAATTR